MSRFSDLSRRALPWALLIALSAAPLGAQSLGGGAAPALLTPNAPAELPRGLISARLLPGWDSAEARITALELVLEPGWKTYWRSPGDSGVPPRFDWGGARATAHWPLPEIILSGSDRTLGYHDRLILPFSLRDPANRLRVDFGLCEDICVPAHLELALPPPGPGPTQPISAALAAGPRSTPDRPACEVAPISDGLRLTLDLPADQGDGIAIEAMRAEIWVSAPEVTPKGDSLSVSADLVDSSGAPFALNPDGLIITQIDARGGGVEMTGCDLAG